MPFRSSGNSNPPAFNSRESIHTLTPWSASCLLKMPNERVVVRAMGDEEIGHRGASTSSHFAGNFFAGLHLVLIEPKLEPAIQQFAEGRSMACSMKSTF